MIAEHDDREAMLELMARFTESPISGVSYLVLILGALGWLILGYGLYRSRATPRAAAVLSALGGAGVMLTTPGPLTSFIAGSAVLCLIGFAWVALAAQRRVMNRPARREALLMNPPRSTVCTPSDNRNACPTASQGPRTTGTASAIVLVAALVLAGCDKGSDGEAQTTTASTSTPATPSGTTEATPLGGGELIVFERTAPGAEERELYAVGPDGGEPRLLRGPGDYPHWSPDGSKLAFLACLNPPDCTTAVALLERSTGDVHGFTMPDPDLYTPCAIWAPSGKGACLRGVLGGRSDAEWRVHHPRLRRQRADAHHQEPGRGRLSSGVLPRRQSTTARSHEPSRGGSANQALFVTPISGGQPHRITPWGYTDDYASWSPDGRTIVFGTNGSLYRVSPEGQGLAKITLEMPDGSSRSGRLRRQLLSGRREDRLLPRRHRAGHLHSPPRRQRCRATHRQSDGRSSRELGCRVGLLGGHRSGTERSPDIGWPRPS